MSGWETLGLVLSGAVGGSFITQAMELWRGAEGEEGEEEGPGSSKARGEGADAAEREGLQ